MVHRVPRTEESIWWSEPIICKLVRRSVKQQILRARREISKVNPSKTGLSEDVSLSEDEHLTPKTQNLLSETKKVKVNVTTDSAGRRTKKFPLRRQETHVVY